MIRKYKNEDLGAVMSIWFKASSLAHSFLNEQQIEEERVKIKDVYIKVTETWVYELNNEVVGFISMCNFEIGGLFVLPFHHRKGIGTSLLEHVRQKYQRLEVEVFSKNSLGLAFYSQMGFEPMTHNSSEVHGNSLLRLHLVKQQITNKMIEK